MMKTMTKKIHRRNEAEIAEAAAEEAREASATSQEQEERGIDLAVCEVNALGAELYMPPAQKVA